MTQTFVCMKWGTRYPASYVNTLWSMIARNTTRRSRLVCYTDDAGGIAPPVEAHPLPPIRIPERVSKKPWRKISLWQPSLPGLSGNVVFLDLDVVITGGLDPFFDHAPDATFCVIENWTQMGSGIGNTSVYRFRIGAHAYLFDQFQDDGDGTLAAHRNSQTYISRTVKSKTFWPADWCVSFKHSLMPRWPLNLIQETPLPASARVVCFTGKPDPDEARDGRWEAPWYKKTYKHVRPTPWIREHWR